MADDLGPSISRWSRCPGHDVDGPFDGNTLTWLAWMTSRPPDTIVPATGTKYAVGYRADFDWLVVEPPAVRAVGEVRIGSKALIRRRRRSLMEEERATDPGSFNPYSFR